MNKDAVTSTSYLLPPCFVHSCCLSIFLYCNMFGCLRGVPDFSANRLCEVVERGDHARNLAVRRVSGAKYGFSSTVVGSILLRDDFSLTIAYCPCPKAYQ
jgi:hypothetical protein